MSIKPTINTVKMAPINISSPAVPNMPIPVFAEGRFNDFLKKRTAMTARVNSTTKAKIMAPMKPKKVFKSIRRSRNVGPKLAQSAVSKPKY